MHRIILQSTLSFVHLIVLNFCECFNSLFAPTERSFWLHPCSSPRPLLKENPLSYLYKMYIVRRNFSTRTYLCNGKIPCSQTSPSISMGRKELSFLPFIENQNPINCGNSILFFLFEENCVTPKDGTMSLHKKWK